jgi:hypothetical protein
VNAQDFAGAAQALAFLRNVLAPTPVFQESIAAVQTPAELIGKPFVRFLRLPSPTPTRAPPDRALAFSQQRFEVDRETRWTNLIAFALDGGETVAVVATDGHEVRRIDGGEVRPEFGAASRRGITSGLLAIDWNHDFRMDVVSWLCRERAPRGRQLRWYRPSRRVSGRGELPEVAHDTTPRVFPPSEKHGGDGRDSAVGGALLFDDEILVGPGVLNPPRASTIVKEAIAVQIGDWVGVHVRIVESSLTNG